MLNLFQHLFRAGLVQHLIIIFIPSPDHLHQINIDFSLRLHYAKECKFNPHPSLPHWWREERRGERSLP
jgi:hypothetical protein